MQIPGSCGVWVATDDDRIRSEVESFGGRVIMTSPDCRNGTERCADALAHLNDAAELILNLQGDAPLSPASAGQQLIERLSRDPQVAMATPAVRCSPALLQHLVTDSESGRVGGTTVVFDSEQRALYFSKRILPYFGGESASEARPAVFQHIGMYAYTRDALLQYVERSPSVLEEVEGLEQLRFLDFGAQVAIELLDEVEWNAVELNNPTDVPIIEGELAALGVI